MDLGCSAIVSSFYLTKATWSDADRNIAGRASRHSKPSRMIYTSGGEIK